MDAAVVLPAILSIISTIVAAYVSIKLSRITTDQKTKSDSQTVKASSDESFRDDLLSTIKLQNEVQLQTNAKLAEYQAVIDTERVKRRMQENENDWLARENTQLKAEKLSFIKEIEDLKQRVLQLESLALLGEHKE